MTDSDLSTLSAHARACVACAAALPFGPRPVFQVSATARILIASQAPGSRVHASGVPFSDPSGEQLRRWMAVSPDEFYDASRIAIVPMALCYPGSGSGGGDAPPRRECAPLWRDRLVAALRSVDLTLLVGAYAQDHVLGRGRVTDRVRHFERYLPDYFPLPHPSWRSNLWMGKHPWFERDVLPRLRAEVRARLGGA